MFSLNSYAISGGIGLLLNDLSNKTSDILDFDKQKTMQDYYKISNSPSYLIDKARENLYPEGKVCDTKVNRTDGCQCSLHYQCKNGSRCIDKTCVSTDCVIGKCEKDGLCVAGSCSKDIGACPYNGKCFDGRCIVGKCNYYKQSGSPQCCQYTGRNQIFTTCPECPCNSYESPCENANNPEDCLNKIPYKGFCSWNKIENKCIKDNNTKKLYATRLKSDGSQMLTQKIDAYNNFTQCYYNMNLPQPKKNNIQLSLDENEIAKKYYGLVGTLSADKIYQKNQYINSNMYRCDCPNKVYKNENKVELSLSKIASLPVIKPSNKSTDTKQASYRWTAADNLTNIPFNIKNHSSKDMIIDMPISQGYHFGSWFSSVSLDKSCKGFTNKGLGCSCRKDFQCKNYKVNTPFTTWQKINDKNIEKISNTKKAYCINNICSIKKEDTESKNAHYYCKYYGTDEKFASCKKCPCHKYKMPCNKARTKGDCLNKQPYQGYCIWDSSNETCTPKGDVPFAYNVSKYNRIYPDNYGSKTQYNTPNQKPYIDIKPSTFRCDCN